MVGIYATASRPLKGNRRQLLPTETFTQFL